MTSKHAPSTPGEDDGLTLRERYADVRRRISAAAIRSGRTADSVLLVAVTKTAGPDEIRELIRLGHVDFGENKVQQLLQRVAIIDEWLGRQRALPATQRAHGDELFTGKAGQTKADGAAGKGAAPAVRWHMIGHMQRNKARKVIETCRLIHSVDSLRLAEEIQQIAFKRDQPVEVLLQVNCSGERSKFGCAIAAAQHLAEQMETMIHVRLRGLMTMAPLTDTPEEARFTFARCRELFYEIRDSGVVSPRFDILSMGMSNDFEVAIEEGANIVRVGSALFGAGKGTGEEPGDGDGGEG